jgi:NitT/TauT family transport system permease protein
MFKKLITPFEEVSKTTRIGITIFWIVVIASYFQFSSNPLIPTPLQIIQSVGNFLVSESFYDNLISSTGLTIKAMIISSIITMLLVYLSKLQLFLPFVLFITKCRYLTLSGLVYIFTTMSDSVDDLKLYLLLFGIIPFFTTSFLNIVNSTPPEEIQKGYVNKSGRWGTLYEVIIVGKLDILFEVMRQNFAISWMMITSVEGQAMSGGGIGTMMIKNTKYLNYGPVIAMLLIVLTLGLSWDLGLYNLRRVIFPHIKIKR